jgi:hypothetical protein
MSSKMRERRQGAGNVKFCPGRETLYAYDMFGRDLEKKVRCLVHELNCRRMQRVIDMRLKTSLEAIVIHAIVRL